MKAVIPVAGAGKRLRPHTYTHPKALIPVAGQPLLAFIIDDLIEAGIDEFVFITGYLGEKIREFVQRQYPNLKVDFVTQEKPAGLGHAIYTVKEKLRGEEILIVLGDTIVEVDLKKIISSQYSCLGLKKVDSPESFGVAEMNEEGFLTRVVEKPRIPKSNLAIVGLYFIKETDVLLDCLSANIQTETRTNNEFQLTDGLQGMLEKGCKIKGCVVNNWYDLGRKEVLLETNAELLKKFKPGVDPEAELNNCIIVDPVSVGKGAIISDSIIGPHVSIGREARIESSIIRESVIGDFSTLSTVVLNRSLIGNDAMVKGLSQSLNIGDNTEIDLSNPGK